MFHIHGLRNIRREIVMILN